MNGTIRENTLDSWRSKKEIQNSKLKIVWFDLDMFRIVKDVRCEKQNEIGSIYVHNNTFKLTVIT